MAGSTKKKGKLFYERTALAVSPGGALISIEQKCPSSWSAGKIVKTQQSKRVRQGVKELGCVIITCSCPNPYQDQLYGKNKRVANPAEGKGAHRNRVRCTSCQAESTNKG